jgi:hypothetical protein
MAVLVVDERRLSVNRYGAACAGGMDVHRQYGAGMAVPGGGGFHSGFMLNDVACLENNNALAIPVPVVVIGITNRKDRYIQDVWIGLWSVTIKL